MFPDTLAALLGDPASRFGDAFNLMREKGLPAAHVVHIEDTGEVLMAGEDGQYRPAHGAIREMVTGEPRRDPARINPVPSYAVRHSPTRLAEHNAGVADMLLYLVRFYWPALAADAETEDAIAEFVAVIGTPLNRGRLVGLSDNYERWNVIAGNFFEYATGARDLVLDLMHELHQSRDHEIDARLARVEATDHQFAPFILSGFEPRDLAVPDRADQLQESFPLGRCVPVVDRVRDLVPAAIELELRDADAQVALHVDRGDLAPVHHVSPQLHGRVFEVAGRDHQLLAAHVHVLDRVAVDRAVVQALDPIPLDVETNEVRGILGDAAVLGDDLLPADGRGGQLCPLGLRQPSVVHDPLGKAGIVLNFFGEQDRGDLRSELGAGELCVGPIRNDAGDGFVNVQDGISDAASAPSNLAPASEVPIKPKIAPAICFKSYHILHILHRVLRIMPRPILIVQDAVMTLTEYLVRRADGARETMANIVAAGAHCTQERVIRR